MKTYVIPQGIEILIEIRLRTLWRWVYKLGYEYKNIRKDVFVDRYKQSNIVEDCKNFLLKMKELKPYMLEFEKDGTIKPKAYTFNCAIEEDER